MLWFGTALAAAPVATLEGSLYDAGGVRIGEDGRVHVLLAPKASRLSALRGVVNVTADPGDEAMQELLGPKVRHAVVSPDGSVAITEIEGPGGSWSPEIEVHAIEWMLRDAHTDPELLRTSQLVYEVSCAYRILRWLVTRAARGDVAARELLARIDRESR